MVRLSVWTGGLCFSLIAIRVEGQAGNKKMSAVSRCLQVSECRVGLVSAEMHKSGCLEGKKRYVGTKPRSFGGFAFDLSKLLTYLIELL